MTAASGSRPGETYMVNGDCVHCGVCEFMCSESAIREAPNQFVIRRQLCNGCGECVPYCPVQAIVPEAEFSARQRQTRRAEFRAVLGHQHTWSERPGSGTATGGLTQEEADWRVAALLV